MDMTNILFHSFNREIWLDCKARKQFKESINTSKRVLSSIKRNDPALWG